MADWATLASLATAGGTLVLALATFAAVRSAQEAARTTERALLASIRPVLVPSHLQDPPEKVGFMDGHWVRVPGGRGVAEVSDGVVYLAMSLRNVGSGLAVLDRWDFRPERALSEVGLRPADDFRRLTRDIYVPAGECGFWQGAFRDPDEAVYPTARSAVEESRAMTVDLLYGDHEGGQRTITRFAMVPDGAGGWLVSASRHWNLDRNDPR